MANISELLEEINAAVYGEDVRDAIHDAIEQCYKDATGNPESISAVVQQVTDLNSNKANLLLVRDLGLTGEATAGGASKDYTFDVTYSGYTFLGVVGFVINAGNACTTVSVKRANASTVVVRTLNTGSSTVTPDSIGISCLYVKS